MDDSLGFVASGACFAVGDASTEVPRNAKANSQFIQENTSVTLGQHTVICVVGSGLVDRGRTYKHDWCVCLRECEPLLAPAAHEAKGAHELIENRLESGKMIGAALEL